MILFLQVAVGATLGFAFIWALTVVGTRFTERRTDAALNAWRARMEIRAIREEAIERLFVASRMVGRRRPMSPQVANDDIEVIEGIVEDNDQ